MKEERKFSEKMEYLMNEYMVYALRDIEKEVEPSTLSTPSLNASVGVTFFNIPNE